MIIVIMVILAFIIAKNWIEDDPNKKKEIRKDGHLVALKTFTSRGQTIRKGTKGGRVESKAEFSLYDNSWADKDSQILGDSVVDGDSLILRSTIKNWRVHNSRVEGCACDNEYEYRGAYWGGDYKGETHHKSNL